MLRKKSGIPWFYCLQHVTVQVCVICALLCESYLKSTTCSDTADCRTNRTTDQCSSDYMQQVGLLLCSVVLNSCYRSPPANSVTHWDNIILKPNYLRRMTKAFCVPIHVQCTPVISNSTAPFTGGTVQLTVAKLMAPLSSINARKCAEPERRIFK
jgi:hypothetical protein